MFEQKPKQIVDTGEIGNASTGDILYDGGVKINDNFDALYNAFADQRFYAAGNGENNQRIHATSYYQKLPAVDYVSSSVPNGSCHDIDTSAGAIFVRLSKGKRGEGVFFINSNGSISRNNPLKIQANNVFSDGNSEITIVSPYTKIECWCIEETVTGESVWNYSISSMFGSKHNPLEKTFTIGSEATVIRIAGAEEFNSIKLLLSCVANPSGKPIKRHSSEVLLLIDPTNKKVYDTEYAVLRIGETSESDKIFTISYSINSSGDVVATVTTAYTNARLAIKAISTQTIGVAQ